VVEYVEEIELELDPEFLFTVQFLANCISKFTKPGPEQAPRPSKSEGSEPIV
jgi:hypothetical protein